MKSNNIIIAYLVALMLVFASCKKEDDAANTTPSAALKTILTNGSWEITQLLDSNNDETGHFSGYEFIFGADGNATATKSDYSISGTWSAENTGGIEKLILNFTTYPFDEITYDWQVTTQNDSLIKAEYLDHVYVSDKYLTFKKF